MKLILHAIRIIEYPVFRIYFFIIVQIHQ